MRVFSQKVVFFLGFILAILSFFSSPLCLEGWAEEGVQKEDKNTRTPKEEHSSSRSRKNTPLESSLCQSTGPLLSQRCGRDQRPYFPAHLDEQIVEEQRGLVEDRIASYIAREGAAINGLDRFQVLEKVKFELEQLHWLERWTVWKNNAQVNLGVGQLFSLVIPTYVFVALALGPSIGKYSGPILTTMFPTLLSAGFALTFGRLATTPLLFFLATRRINRVLRERYGKEFPLHFITHIVDKAQALSWEELARYQTIRCLVQAAEKDL